MATVSTVDPQRILQTPNLNKWPIFSLLNPEFINSIKLVSVFGGAGNEAIIVTRDDDVFSLGSNCSSCLGLGDMQSGLEPRRVDVLCQKKVLDFAYGSGPHVLAITELGDLYSWGHNGYSQLGHSGSTQPVLPTRVSGLTGIQIIQICCGSHHSLSLTSDGEVYAWGYNNCGQIGSGNSFVESEVVPGEYPGHLLQVLFCGPGFHWTNPSQIIVRPPDFFLWPRLALGLMNSCDYP